MRPIAELPRGTALALDAVVFDLDDTLLDHGRLSEAAYAALFRLRESGLRLIVSTGRPALWAEIVARQWPIDLALAENGAIACVPEHGGVRIIDSVPCAERTRRRATIDAVADDLCRLHNLERASDHHARISDVTLDIGERVTVTRETIDAARADAHRRGVRTFVSSVHMHLTLDAHDKASGFATFSKNLGHSPVRALSLSLYVGDSGNDAAAFAAFRVTVGVANVQPWLRTLSVPPRYVTQAPMGAGFVELASVLVTLRRTS